MNEAPWHLYDGEECSVWECIFVHAGLEIICHVWRTPLGRLLSGCFQFRGSAKDLSTGRKLNRTMLRKWGTCEVSKESLLNFWNLKVNWKVLWSNLRLGFYFIIMFWFINFICSFFSISHYSIFRNFFRDRNFKFNLNF